MTELLSRLLEKLSLLPILNKHGIGDAFKDKHVSTLIGAAGAVLVLLWSTYLITGKLISQNAEPSEKNMRITKLLVHPIKSCRGTSMQEVRYNANGVENDRKWLIIKRDSHNFVTARELPRTVLISPKIRPDLGIMEVSFPPDSGIPSFSVPLNPSEKTIKSWEYLTDIVFWFGKKLDGYVVESSSPTPSESPSELISRFLGISVLLVMKGPNRRAVPVTALYPQLEAHVKFQDGFPLFLATEESLKDLQSHISVSASGTDGKWRVGKMDTEAWKDGGRLKIERFRPNIVISGVSKPWVEDTWAEIAVEPSEEGGHDVDDDKKLNRIEFVKKGTRCLLPNVNPEDGIRDEAVPYKVMTKFRTVYPDDPHTPCFGQNCVPVVPPALRGGREEEAAGVLKVGDRIRVTRMLSPKELKIVTKQTPQRW